MPSSLTRRIFDSFVHDSDLFVDLLSVGETVFTNDFHLGVLDTVENRELP